MENGGDHLLKPNKCGSSGSYNSRLGEGDESADSTRFGIPKVMTSADSVTKQQIVNPLVSSLDSGVEESPIGKNAKSYSSKYVPGSAASMIVGLPQTWPLLAPTPYYCSSYPYSNTTPAGTANNPGLAFGYTSHSSLFYSNPVYYLPNSSSPMPISISLPPPPPPPALRIQTKSCINAAAEVTVPITFSVGGKSISQYQKLIEDFGDQWYESGAGSGSQAAGDLANQIFTDNNELLYVIITDVASYPITSKPHLWSDSDSSDDLEVGSSSRGLLLGETIAFSSLFNVGEDIFVVFLFSPNDILFTIEQPFESLDMLSSIFFHGKTRVAVKNSQTSRVITIQFFDHELPV